MLKKHFLIAATGMAAVFLLAGCSPDMIEHQFHTDVSVDTEYVTLDPVDVENTQIFQTVDQFLNKYGLGLRLSLLTENRDTPIGDVNTTSISPEALDAWLKDAEKPLYIYKKWESDSISFHDQLAVTMESMKQFYTAFQQVSEEEWITLRGSIPAINYNVLPVIYLHSYLIESDGEHYVELWVSTSAKTINHINKI